MTSASSRIALARRCFACRACFRRMPWRPRRVRVTTFARAPVDLYSTPASRPSPTSSTSAPVRPWPPIAELVEPTETEEAMPYQAEISRDHPTCFLFVIDQSGSMDEITETGRSKADFVADVLNKTLYTLVTSCSKAEGVRNYFDVGVIAYGGSGGDSGLGGARAGGRRQQGAAMQT